MAKPVSHRPPSATGVFQRASGLRTFTSLKVPNYRYFMSASLFQMACMNMQMLASGWFVYKLTGSSALLGLTALVSAVPQLTISFIGGSIADRASKKKVIILGLLASSLAALFIAFSTTLGIITWHYLLVSSLAQGIIMSLTMPARQSIVPELVGRDNLMNAAGLNAAVMNVTQIGAPAIAGFMVAGMGIEGVYYLIAAMYIAAILLLVPMKYVRRVMPNAMGKRNMFREILDGLSYVRRNRTLLTILVLTMLTFMLSMPFRMLLPVFTEGVMSVGPEALGILISLSGIGALGGSLVIASMGNKGRGMLFLHTGMLTGASIVAFVIFTHSFALALIIMFISGIGQSGRMALSNTLIQSYTDDGYQGRVMSLFMMQGGVTSLGVFATSLAAEFVGIQWAVGATAGLLILITGYYYAFSPKIRRLD